MPPDFMLAIKDYAQEENSHNDGRGSGHPEEDFAKLFVVHREHENNRSDDRGE